MKKYLKTMFLFLGFVCSLFVINNSRASAQYEGQVPVASYDVSKLQDDSIKVEIYESITDNTQFDMYVYGAGEMVDFTETIPWVSIENNSYNPIYNITKIVIEDNVTDIGGGLFAFLNTESVTIPSSVASIGEASFAYNKLLSIDIPSTVTEVGDSAFAYASGITSVTGMEGLETISVQMFAYTGISTIDIPNNIKEIGTYAFLGCSSLTSVTGMEGVEVVKDRAFSRTSISNFHVTPSMRQISGIICDYCDSFVEFVVDNENTRFSVSNGILYNKDKTTLYAYPSSINDRAYRVEDSTRVIANRAFASNRYLESIVFSSATSVFGENLLENTNVREIIINSPAVQLRENSFEHGNLLRIIGHISSEAHTYAKDRNIEFESLCSLTTGESQDGSEKYIKTTDCNSIIVEVSAPEKNVYTSVQIVPEVYNPHGVDLTYQFENSEGKMVEPVDVDTYKAYITYSGVSVVFEYEIIKAVPEVIAPESSNAEYNWQLQPIITTGSTTGGTFEYKLDGGEWSEELPMAKEPGSYTVWYRVVGDKNFHSVSESSLTATISKAKLVVVNPIAITGLIYNGESQALVVPGVSNVGLMSYKIGEGNWSTDTPEVVDAGNYVVYYKVEIQDYETYGPYSCTVTIEKATATLTAPTAKNDLVYNGEEQELVNAGSTTGGTLEYRVDNYPWSSDIASATIPATYTVWYRVNGGINYYDIAASSFEVTIDKATPVVTAPIAKDLTYNGESQELVQAGTSDVGVINYSLDNETWSENIPSATNANTYTLWYKLVVNEYYYPVGPLSVEVEIKKADPIYTAPRARELVFNNDTQELIFPGNSMYGTFEYKLDDGEWDVSLPIALDIGTYTVWYRLNAIENYKDVEATLIEVTIEKTTPHVIAPTPKTLSYTGSEQVLVNEGTTTLGEIEYSFDEITWSTSLPTKKDAGEYTVWYRVEETSNYNGVGPVSMTVIINKITLTITADNKEMDERDEYPTFTYKVEGLVGNDTLITEPTITIDGNDAKNKSGEYGLVIANANAGKNYDIVYVNAKLVVHNKISTGEVFIIIGSIVGTISIAAAAFFIFKFKKNRILINRA